MGRTASQEAATFSFLRTASCKQAPVSLVSKKSREPRDRILVVFDERYTSNGNVVYAATRHLVTQLQGHFRYRVFCRGKYTGPRFGWTSRVRVVGRKLAPFAQGMRLRDRIERKLARYHAVESQERWICNLDADEQPLLRLLFDADRYHAIIVFSHDPAYALRVVKLAHIYATDAIPHLIVVTPAMQVPQPIVGDIRRLGGRILQDGEPTAQWDTKPVEGATAAGLSDNGLMGLATVPNLRAMLESFDYHCALSFLDKTVFPYQASAANAAVNWSDWIGADQLYRTRVRDVILFVRPDWMKCGSGTLFASVAQWFLDNDGLMIDIAIWPFRVPFDVETRDDQIAAEQRHIQSALYFSLRQSTSVPYLLRRMSSVLRHFPWTVASQTLLRYNTAAAPRLMTTALREAKITHIYLNHYFTYGYARSLIKGRKFFLDTHDIQAINFIHGASRNLITSRTDPFAALFRDEMRVAGLAEHLGFVSQEELDLAASVVPRHKMSFIIPIPLLKPCEPKPVGKLPRLLVVASGNPHNRRNINWFLTEIWPIMLAQARAGRPEEPSMLPFEVVICGSIVDLLPPVEIAGIRLLGVVEDLREQYESCDLVLLPVISGGGVGIKTIEAVLYERPVVATLHALRGLPPRVVDAIGYVSDAAMFARQVVSVVTSKPAHALQTERSRRGANALRDENFYQRLDRAMDAVRLDRHRAAATVRNRLPEPKFHAIAEPALGD